MDLRDIGGVHLQEQAVDSPGGRGDAVQECFGSILGNGGCCHGWALPFECGGHGVGGTACLSHGGHAFACPFFGCFQVLFVALDGVHGQNGRVKDSILVRSQGNFQESIGLNMVFFKRDRDIHTVLNKGDFLCQLLYQGIARKV